MNRTIITLTIFVISCINIFAEGVSVFADTKTTTNSASQTSLGGWIVDQRIDASGIWVDKASGSDANPGTYFFPYATITKASSVAVPGDTIKIRAGNYIEVVTNKTAGTSGSPITYTTANGYVTFGALILTNDFITVDGLNQLTLNGTNNTGTTAGSIWLKPGAHNCIFKNLDVNSAQTPITNGVNNPNGPSPIVASGSLLNGYYDNTGVTNIIFANVSITNGGLHNVALAGCDRVIISNCLFSGNNGWDCIRALGDNIRVVACNFSNYSNPGSSNGVHTDIFNTFPNNGEHGTNLIFERSTIYQAIGQVQWNLGANKGGTNESFKFLTVRNNKFYNMNGQIQSNIPYTWVYNNTFYLVATNSAANPVSWAFLMDASHGDAYNGRSYNNAYIACGDDPGFPPAFFNANGWYDTYSNTNGSNWNSGLQFTFQADYDYACGWPTQAGATWIYPKKRVGAYPLWGSTNSQSIAYEAHGINGGDPGLDSTNYAGFNPTNGSILKLAGTNLTAFFGSEPAVDFNGNPRPSGTTAWTIGAVQ